MKTYDIRIRHNSDFFVDEELDVPELNTFVTVGVRNDYSTNQYVVYVDLRHNERYLETREGFYDTEFETTLVDEEMDIAFHIWF